MIFDKVILTIVQNFEV